MSYLTNKKGGEMTPQLIALTISLAFNALQLFLIVAILDQRNKEK